MYTVHHGGGVDRIADKPTSRCANPSRPPLPIEISTTAAPAGSGEGLFVFGVLHKVQRTSLSLRLVQLGVRGSTLGGTPHHPLTRLFARSGALQAE
jgi:hypothetical protein